MELHASAHWSRGELQIRLSKEQLSRMHFGSSAVSGTAREATMEKRRARRTVKRSLAML